MNAINLKLEELYQGKATMIKDNEYLPTKLYVEPFINKIDQLCQGNIIIKAQPATQISLTPQGDANMEDIVFNKVWIQGIIPGDYPNKNYKQTINMVYALDTRKPLVKIFKSIINTEDSTMYVFNPEHLSVKELKPNTVIDYSFVDTVLPMVDEAQVRLDELSKESFDPEDLKDKMGSWIETCIKSKYINNFGTIKLSETLPIEVYKRIFLDEDSPNFAKNGIVDGLTVYKVFSDIITNDKGKDVVNKFEKIYMVTNLLKANND